MYNKWCENLHGEGGKDAYEDEGDDVDLDVGDDDIDLGDDDLWFSNHPSQFLRIDE